MEPPADPPAKRGPTPPKAASTTDPRVLELRRLAVVALGDTWVYRLAKALQVSIRSVQRWNSGDHPVPERALVWLRKNAAARLRSDFEMKVRELVQREKGTLDLLVIAAMLRDLAAEATVQAGITPEDEEALARALGFTDV